MAYTTKDSDSTIKEQRDARSLTIRDASPTGGRHFSPQRSRTSAGSIPRQDTRTGRAPRFSSALGALYTPSLPVLFRGWRILEQLPTRGAEADLYITRAYGERHVLKLYRNRLEPKLEILSKIADISRRNSHCFVVLAEAGFDEESGRWYELQEYIPRGSLRELCMDEKRTPHFVMTLLFELTEAIECLHENGIVHCDIKPANVLVRSVDPLDLVLTDFGISSLVASDVSQRMTSLKGTPMYWAPEAFSNVVGRPRDWWGLGMVALEILLGEHPFEGLSDAQVIRKLTLGNVEITDSLDPIWAMMVKGLLTKDDSKRWGWAELSRWLAGDYDIPVHYEAPTSLPTLADRTNPFRFEGVGYCTTEELARAFAEKEGPWSSPSSYMRFIRQWFEGNMLFDEAAAIGKAITESNPELALFRFVHGNARLPFSVQGRIIDARNLRLFLGKAVRLEASEAEGRIVKMLGDGRLRSYYIEYETLSGEGNSFMSNLLSFMEGKSPDEQLCSFDALMDPKSFVWPDDAKTGTEEERLESLRAMGPLLLRSDDLTRVQASFVLPSALMFLLGSTKTYASAAERLELWRSQGMLLPKGQGGQDDDLSCENMSIEEYIRTSRIRCLGHTRIMLERLDFLIDSLPTVAPPRDHFESSIYSRMILRLRRLKDQKIAGADSMFIVKASALFDKRATLERFKPARFAAALAGGLAASSAFHLAGNDNAVLGFLLRTLVPSISAFFLLVTLLAIVTACGSFFRGDYSRGHDPRNLTIFAGGAVSVVLLALIRSRYFFYGVAFFAGASLGYAVVHAIIKAALHRNGTKILDAGSEYCYDAIKLNPEDFR
jgi:serine/threonine protein kinase